MQTPVEREKTRIQEQLRLLQEKMDEARNAIERLQRLEVAVSIFYDPQIQIWREKMRQGIQQLKKTYPSGPVWSKMFSETQLTEFNIQQECVHELLLEEDQYISRDSCKKQTMYKCIVCGIESNKKINPNAFVKNVENERCRFKEPREWYRKVDWFTFNIFAVEERELISLFL